MAEQHVHWKQMVNIDYLGAYALSDGNDMIVTIKTVRKEQVTGPNGKKEECVVAHFAENCRPMILNRTNMKMITKVHKTPYIDQWAGKKIQLYVDTTRFGGETVECLRIRPFIPQEAAPVKCEGCGANIAAMNNMTPEQIAAYTKQKYGKALCGKCATKAAEGAK